ncbi:MAG TPA: LuxR C-terminal-related transcriptional regulator [Xanthomonadaceae bacterium]
MQASIPEPEFVLKATPPRMPRTTLRREHLARRWTEIRRSSAIAIVAPDGFGKSTLLLQWRRMWLEQGALVAWLTADARDHPVRWRMALAHALQNASGRSRVDALAARHAARLDLQVEGLAGLLAEIARLRVDVVLMFDECERLPETTVGDGLAYLIHNAPPNLHVVMSSNAPLRLAGSAGDEGLVVMLGQDDLRLRDAESNAILVRRVGSRLDPEDCTRLHKAAEGWPMGLQLAASAIEHGPASAHAIEAVTWLRGPLETRFIEALLARLPADISGFLVRIAILDHMNAELCGIVTGSPSATAFLAKVMLDTPLLIVGQTKDWSCLHPLARSLLLARFARLPAGERHELHRRACTWFAQHERPVEAARHAVEAGEPRLAGRLHARLLWHLASEGRLVEAREALVHVPAEDIGRDVDLRLIVGWILACGDRHAEALEDAQRLLAEPGLDAQSSFVAALVAASAAAYADRLGLIPGLLARWPEGSAAIESSGHTVVYANCLSVYALHRGETAHLRDLEPRSPAASYRYSPALSRAFGRALVGLSHLWDGYPDRAEAVVRPAMLQAEQASGRRSVVACVFAAVAAAALLERNQPKAALALLAGRLDVIESTAIPDVILCAYRTLAYAASSRGETQQALGILDDLRRLADAQRMPRLALNGLVEQIRIHALEGRIDAVGELEAELDALAPVFADVDHALFRPQYDLLSAIARSHASLARSEIGAAERHLLTADALATELGRGRDLLVVRVLRAVVARQRGAPLALRLLGEALSLGKLGGNRRLLQDSHPLAAEMAMELKASTSAGKKAVPRSAGAAETAESPQPASASCGLLTPKEARILDLLNQQLPEDSIAEAMSTSDEAVRWHIGHLLAKLSVDTRAGAVARARLLGLIEG